MDRRKFLHGTALSGAGLITTALTACTTTPENPVPPSATTRPASTTALTPGENRVLMAYFSRAGENYYYGGRTNLDVGNTQRVADMIAAATAVDVYRIEAADPYPDSYDETVRRNVQEEDADARPAIANPLPDITGYDTVLLGSPVWNVQTPMIMRTFVESAALTGKIIHPFVTFAVSGLGRVDDDYERLCPDSTIGEGLAIRGEETQSAAAEIDEWLRRIGLLTS